MDQYEEGRLADAERYNEDFRKSNRHIMTEEQMDKIQSPLDKDVKNKTKAR